MRFIILFAALVPISLHAQDPATVDQFRDQLSRITPTPLTDTSDLRREALRAPLYADPKTPLNELQSAQTALIRLADAPTIKLNTPADFTPTPLAIIKIVPATKPDPKILPARPPR